MVRRRQKRGVGQFLSNGTSLVPRPFLPKKKKKTGGVFFKGEEGSGNQTKQYTLRLQKITAVLHLYHIH